MKTNTNAHLCSKTQTATKAKCIKLGIDVHADSYRVVLQIDHATPQPVVDAITAAVTRAMRKEPPAGQ